MRASHADRERLDRRLAEWKELPSAVPPRGWLRAIRDALAMSQADLASRIGVSRQRVDQLERAEVDGSIQLATLRRAAEALDCTLVYALVPRSSLEDTVRRQAEAVAGEDVTRVAQTMLLEGQTGGAADVERLQREAADRIIGSRRLWRS
jgi:predicted DNA-binding mobile mystery protein A